jgi:hypothetical protein
MSSSPQFPQTIIRASAGHRGSGVDCGQRLSKWKSATAIDSRPLPMRRLGLGLPPEGEAA